MSKYPVKYLSGTKKAELNIEDMATPHLCNAWRKMGGMPKDEFEKSIEVFQAIASELQARGGTYMEGIDKWEFPPKPEEEA